MTRLPANFTEQAPFKMIGVGSSNVSAIGYDCVEKILFVGFIGGGLYEYKVSYETFRAMLASGSKGRFVWNHLR